MYLGAAPHVEVCGSQPRFELRLMIELTEKGNPTHIISHPSIRLFAGSSALQRVSFCQGIFLSLSLFLPMVSLPLVTLNDMQIDLAD